MNENLRVLLAPYPRSRELVRFLLESWPQHERYLEQSFRDRPGSALELGESTARKIFRIHGTRIGELVAGYRWMCEMVFEEELHFRRTGLYRHRSYSEVEAAVYHDRAMMGRYMDGLLASEVLWSQHARLMDFYVNGFLARLPEGYRHLEIGPGHGLLLAYAALEPRCGSLTAWDISPASLELTRVVLERLGIERSCELTGRDVREPVASAAFDSVVLSEVLEHLEDPLGVLRSVAGLLADEGLVFVNVPVNAPAIDHLFLLETPEAAVELAERSGLEVLETHFAPIAGYSLAKARRARGSISCGIIARRRSSGPEG